MAVDVHVRPGLVIPAGELQVRFTPSGGPGGQHANRSNTRVELTWNIEGSTAVTGEVRERLIERLGPVTRVVVDDERSQLRNRELAVERLRARVSGALHNPTPRRKTKPTRSSKRRRVEGKRKRGELKQQRRRPGYDD